MDQRKVQLIQKYFRSFQRLPKGKHRVVAGIWEKNELIALGFNEHKTHPLQKESQLSINPQKEFLHAEIHALIQASKISTWRPDRSFILIYREGRSGVPLLAAPCGGCLEALRRAGLSKIFYSTCNDVSPWGIVSLGGPHKG